MNKILRLVLLALAAVILLYFFNKKSQRTILKEESLLIEKQIKNVGKLIVTEGHFSEVFNYKNSRTFLGDMFTLDKKALVVVNANVSISYDLSKISYSLDQENKILLIKSIPKEEITISPDLEYYDVQSDFLNPFKAEDYNQIKETINNSLLKKIDSSNIKQNAKGRLLSELAKFYIVTNSLNWKLIYNDTPINTTNDLQSIKL